jgi:hypothetical protein
MVYEPILGTREALVTRKHIPEALKLIKTINVELTRVMNQQAIDKAFANPEEILSKTANTPIWEPFDIQKSIPYAIRSTFPPPYQHNTPKRPRSTTTKPNRTQQQTYAAAVTTHENTHTINQQKSYEPDSLS